MDSVLSLDNELDSIKCLHAYELVRYMPNELLMENDAKMINGMAPLVFLNKFKSKKMAKKLWEHLMPIDADIFKRNSAVIFKTITEQGLDSGLHEDRVAGAKAITELCKQLSEA